MKVPSAFRVSVPSDTSTTGVVVTVNRVSSTSESFSNKSSTPSTDTKVPSSSTENASAVAFGSAFGMTEILAVAIDVWSLPSVISYSKESLPLKPRFGVYVNVPSGFRVTEPSVGPTTGVVTTAIASPSASMSLPSRSSTPSVAVNASFSRTVKLSSTATGTMLTSTAFENSDVLPSASIARSTTLSAAVIDAPLLCVLTYAEPSNSNVVK